MESDIKVKATAAQMNLFSNLYCVKRFVHIEWLNDGKCRNLYEVTLRHADSAGELHGTYTVEYLMKKFREYAYTNLPCHIAGVVNGLINDVHSVLSVLGDKQNVMEFINDALQKESVNVYVQNKAK